MVDKTSVFIGKAISIHGQRYDYKNVMYINAHTKVNITCHKHGAFEQYPTNHLAGVGCKACAYEEKKISYRKSQEGFVQEAMKKHGDLYDYSLSEYLDWNTKVKIICKKHGIFEQRALKHIQGQGCPRCSKNISKKEILWLNSLGIPVELRNQTIHLNQRKFIKVDAFDKATNTVYEFYGDYWHGNPNKHDPNNINAHNKKSFGALYMQTLERQNLIRAEGYNLVFIWESDFIE